MAVAGVELRVDWVLLCKNCVKSQAREDSPYWRRPLSPSPFFGCDQFVTLGKASIGEAFTGHVIGPSRADKIGSLFGNLSEAQAGSCTRNCARMTTFYSPIVSATLFVKNGAFRS
jgi:hypothetical protein